MKSTSLSTIKDLLASGEFQFVSFKYLDNDGRLKQFDMSAQSFISGYFEKKFGNKKIEIFNGAAFEDPFRSHSTLTVFGVLDGSICYKIRNDLAKLDQRLDDIEVAISFWVEDNELDFVDPELHQSDPEDIYANLRSEISLALEKIGIRVCQHYHGGSKGESVVTLEASSLCTIVDQLVIARFIIANCASSYGVKASLYYKNLPNISFICNNVEKNIYSEKKLQAKNEQELYSFIYKLYSGI